MWCCVRYFFWFWREIVFGVTYVLSVQYSCVVLSVFLLCFPPNLSCLQNNPLENNVEPVPAKSELPQKHSAGKLCGASSRQIWAASKTIPQKIMWSQFPPILSRVIWDLAGTRSTLFSGELFWDRFLLDLIKKFFGTPFRYKLMYCYFYHGSDLREIIPFLRKIECIQFE